MKGLLLKEAYSAKIYLKNLALFFGLMIILCLALNMGPGYLSMMSTVYMVVISSSLNSVDEVSKWDRYAVALPVKRNTIVGARYLCLFLIMLGMLALSTAVSIPICLIKSYPGWQGELGVSVLYCLSMFFFVNAVSTPLVYKYGAEKSRMLVMIVFMVPMLGFVFLAPRLEGILNRLPAGGLFAGGIALMLLLMAGYLVSWYISTRIYLAKEF